MNKAVQALVAAGAIAFSSGAMAQYVTLAGGVSHLDVNCEGTSNCDKTDNMLKAIGGLRLGNSGWAVELGYIDWGASTATDLGTHLEISVRSTTLGLAHRGEFARDWEGYIRLGAAYNQVKGTATGFLSGSESENDFEPYLGLGIRYAFTKTVKLDLGVDFTQAEFGGGQSSVTGVSLGVTLDF